MYKTRGTKIVCARNAEQLEYAGKKGILLVYVS
jgi:hypothetical protein